MISTQNKALHLTAIPLRFIAVGELGRSMLEKRWKVSYAMAESVLAR